LNLITVKTGLWNIGAAEHYNQLKQQPQPLQKCTSVFHRSTGFPCTYMILERLFRNEPLQPSDFHPQWQFCRGEGSEDFIDPRLLICDPVVAPSRRHRLLNVTTSGPIQSGFETVEKAINAAIETESHPATIIQPPSTSNQITSLDGSSARLEITPISQSQTDQQLCPGCKRILHFIEFHGMKRCQARRQRTTASGLLGWNNWSKGRTDRNSSVNLVYRQSSSFLNFP
jgi:hypothetical protein